MQHVSAASPRASVSIFFHGEIAAATDRFSAASLLGAGGFGSVYMVPPQGLAGLSSDSRYLAVKKLDGDSMQGYAEFLQEVQVLGACRHENILPLVCFSACRGVTREEDGVCLVTPLMRGGSLADRLSLDASARRRLDKMPGAPPAAGWVQLTWQQRVLVLLDALKGLDYLHTPDPVTHKPTILHRDIKPDNILLDTDSRARLGDMGLARQQRPAANNATTMMFLAGTNGFMDEYYQDTGKYDKAADAYAMGISILMTLTGLPAVDQDQGNLNGRCEVEDDAEIVALADVQAQWPREVAIEVHKVGMALIKRHANRARRMTVRQARERLQSLADAYIPPAPPEHESMERECILCMSAPRHVRFEWWQLCIQVLLCFFCVALSTNILTYSEITADTLPCAEDAWTLLCAARRDRSVRTVGRP